MNGNYQPTSAPYNADNLKPHDTQLVWSREFGTETTEDTGQPFNGLPGESTVDTINARTGFLQCDQLSTEADEDSVNGTTFLTPPLSSFPPSPVFGDGPDAPRAIVLFAHLLFKEAPEGGPSAAMLMLAGESFVGNVSGTQAFGVGIVADAIPEESSAIISAWGDGAGQEPESETAPHWGSNLYFRCFIVGNDDKESDTVIWASRDGLTWTMINDGSQIMASGEPFRRVGIGITGGQGIGYLDWVRIYSYPVTGVQGQMFLPEFPLTGDRRY